jgi:glycosyltransferase involved in cell wall biosynthesis
MPRFVLLDHSIKRLGGHNFEYAVQVLAAAKQAGYEPVLAVNRRFFEGQNVPADWLVVPTYTHTTYEIPKWQERRRSLDPRGEFATRSVREEENQSPSLTRRAAKAEGNPARASLWQTLTKPIRQWRYQNYLHKEARFIERFANETAQLCQRLELGPGDQILISTLHESEVLALARLFRRDPATARIDWHWQFHFRLFPGREPEYAAQLPRAEHVRAAFAEIAALPNARVKAYCTTERLADQYRQLGELPMRVLSWPINPALFAARPPRDPEQPLRVGVPGCVRAEKGQQHLVRVLQGMEREFVETREVQFLLQSHRLGKLAAPLRQRGKMVATPEAALNSTEPVTVVKWPLSSEDYLRFLRQTDIGLLLYNADDYYARLSAILVEQLAAGIPVIVPAGCWLAEQIAEPNWRHLDRLREELPALREVPAAEWSWMEPSPSTWFAHPISKPRLHQPDRASAEVVLCEPDRPQRSAVFAVDSRASHLAVDWSWVEPAVRGRFLKIEAAARNSAGMTLQRWTEITERRPSIEKQATPTQGIFLPLPEGTAAVELTFRNAYGSEAIVVRHLTARCLDAHVSASGCPLSAVGLIAADVSMAVPLVREMVKHYTHYRATAEQHAAAIQALYAPSRVIEQLDAVTQTPLKRAA